MTTINSNERERLDETRERNEERKQAFAVWKERGIVIESLPVPDAITDIDFLLSLLDSQAESIELLQKIPAVANEALNMTLGQIQEAAASRMRDKCVEAVKAMRREWHDRYIAADSSSREALVRKEMLFAQVRAARDIITALESLTLDQVEQK